MSEFQQMLLDMSDEDIQTAVADAMTALKDISAATGQTITVMAFPDHQPILITDGEVNTDYSDRPLNSIMGDPLGQLGRL